MANYDLGFTPTASRMLAEITAGKREKIARKIGTLSEDAQSRGKPLGDELAGLRSMRAAGRYRVVFRVSEPEEIGEIGTVVVVAVGIRRDGSKDDIYEIAAKLSRRGQL